MVVCSPGRLRLKRPIAFFLSVGRHGSELNSYIRRRNACSGPPRRMARRHFRTLPGTPAGEPGHSPQRGSPEFAAFCTRNPKPCPLIEITPPGDPEPARSAPAADLRTDVGGYRVYRNGELTEQRREIRDLWRDDLVAFLLGCSHTFDHALIEAGVGVRNVECNTTVSMFVTNVACRPAGRFHGPIVMTMRPIPEGQVQLVSEFSGRYPHAHGSPIHVGNPRRLGSKT